MKLGKRELGPEFILALVYSLIGLPGQDVLEGSHIDVLVWVNFGALTMLRVKLDGLEDPANKLADSLVSRRCGGSNRPYHLKEVFIDGVVIVFSAHLCCEQVTFFLLSRSS